MLHSKRDEGDSVDIRTRSNIEDLNNVIQRFEKTVLLKMVRLLYKSNKKCKRKFFFLVVRLGLTFTRWI